MKPHQSDSATLTPLFVRLARVAELFERDSTLLEKYVLRPTAEHATGGEYPRRTASVGPTG